MGFFDFLKEGFLHISDIGAYDHMLFITVLCASYPLRLWKRVALLVTAFTVGHSIALALATTKIVQVDSALVEFLIPVTILLACIFNLFTANRLKDTEASHPTTESGGNSIVMIQYITILMFGLIHGLGFSNYIRMMLMSTQSIFTPLLAFNIGLELGQLIIVAIVLGFSYLVVDIIKLPAKLWTILISGFAALIAMKLTVETATAYFYG